MPLLMTSSSPTDNSPKPESTQESSVTPPSRGSLGVIFATVFIDLLGFGMVLPILPIYAKKFGADPSGWKLGMLMAIFSIMQFFFAPVWEIGRAHV